MKAICQIEADFITPSFPLSEYCPAHTLPYYMTLLQNTTCEQLTERDLDEVCELLIECDQYYYTNRLAPNRPPCKDPSCDDIPLKCFNYNAVYNIFHYHTDVDFMKNGTISNRTPQLTYSPIIFRRSWNVSRDQLYDYYKANLLEKKISNEFVEVKAIDVNMIFEEVNTYYVLTDLPFYGLAMALVVIVLFFYLRSFALMIVVMLNVGLTLLVSYFIYHVVCRLVYFGFTNLLAGLLLIAIGADDVFIFTDIWKKIKSDAPDDNISIAELTSHTLKHAFLSILVTSLTTAAALFANAVSSVIALRCFGIFGGICITVNLFFMVTLVPAILVILEKFSRKYPSFCRCKSMDKCFRMLENISGFIWEKIVPKIVIKGAVVWLILLLAAGVYGFVVVFYSPRLRLPDSERFQVFYTNHPIEVYRFIVKDKMRFELENQQISQVNINLNFVFGVSGRDNGNVFDPDDTGSLEFEDDLDIYAEQNQVWLKKFCNNLLNDDGIYNKTKYVCFMGIFETVVESNCTYSAFNITLRAPCCNNSFPMLNSDAETCYSERDFIRVIKERTKTEYRNQTLIGSPVYNPESGKLIATTFRVKTNSFWSAQYTKMDSFYRHFQDFMERETETAPDGLKHGWFSGAFGQELYFYDFQSVMVRGCILGIGLSMAVAFLIMLVTSGNFFITVYAIFTIVLIIVVTVGILVLLGWELGVSEALVITLTVGLSIDFTIHFGVAYKVSKQKTRDKKVSDAISTVGFAVTMAALTTFLSGSALMGGRVLSYYRFGLFLMLDMTVSWVFALFFFMPMCRFIGPVGFVGEIGVLFSYYCCRGSKSKIKSNQKYEPQDGIDSNEKDDIPLDEIVPNQSSTDENLKTNNQNGSKHSLTNGVDIIRHDSDKQHTYANPGYTGEKTNPNTQDEPEKEKEEDKNTAENKDNSSDTEKTSNKLVIEVE